MDWFRINVAWVPLLVLICDYLVTKVTMVNLMDGGLYFSIEEARARDLLKPGYAIQIKRGLTYSHTILFKSYDKCYHVSSDPNNFDSLTAALTLGSGVRFYVCRHALVHILYSGPRDQNGDPIIQTDDMGNVIPPTLDLLRVNNQEEEARRRGIDVHVYNTSVYLDKMFEELDNLVFNRTLVHYNLFNNCEDFVYGMKYGMKCGQEWSPQRQFYLWDLNLKYRPLIGLIILSMIIIYILRNRLRFDRNYERLIHQAESINYELFTNNCVIRDRGNLRSPQT